MNYMVMLKVCEMILVLLLVLVVLIFVCGVVWEINNFTKVKKINKFFDRNEAESGSVVGYTWREGKGSTYLLPFSVGNSTIFLPHHHEEQDQYFIAVKCFKNEIHFLAKYAIPACDFEKYKINSIVKIKPHWKRYGYTILER